MSPRILMRVAGICAGVLALPLVSLALGLPGLESSLSIVPTPAHPAPGAQIRLEARSPAIDLADYTLVWKADSKVIGEGKGLDSVEVTMGASGKATEITLTVTAQDGGQLSARATITPAELDILFDTDAYVPPFYRGRARPSPGTRVFLQAIPRGAPVAASQLTYRWKRSGEVIGAVSGRGRSQVIVNAPFLYGSDSISVEARSDDGLFDAEASVVIPAVEPRLFLYQDHPLYGILFNRALGKVAAVPESEMTFAAIPLFAQAVSPNDPRLEWAWRVNDRSIASSPPDPSEITLSAKDSSGQALIELGLTHATNFFIDSRGSWFVTLSSGGSQNGLFRGQGQ